MSSSEVLQEMIDYKKDIEKDLTVNHILFNYI